MVGLDQGASKKAGHKWLEMESGLKEEPMELGRGLDLGDEKRQRSKR